MNKADLQEHAADPDPHRPDGTVSGLSPSAGRGVNLALIYSLVALAFAAAIGFALLIVLPFHHRH